VDWGHIRPHGTRVGLISKTFCEANICTEVMGLKMYNLYDKIPRSTAVLEKLIVDNLVKFHVSCVHRKLISVFVTMDCYQNPAPMSRKETKTWQIVRSVT
jgi:hypothetical protein